MKNSIKREQSQACLNFAERKNFRLQAKYKIIMTLALLLTAVTGAWAQTETLLTTITATDKDTYSETTPGVVTVTLSNVASYSSTYGWLWGEKSGPGSVTVEAKEGYTITQCVFKQNDKTPVTITTSPFAITFANGKCEQSTHDIDGVTSIEVYGNAPAPAEPAIDVKWDPATKTGNFKMPAYDVEIAPIYAPVAQWAKVEDVDQLPKAIEGVIADTDAPLIVEGTVAFAGTSTEVKQGTVMYAVTPATVTEAPALDAANKWSADVPTAKLVADGGIDVLVWYYIKGADTPEGQQATEENTFNDSEICAEPIKVTVLTNKFDIQFNAANAYTIEAGKATVTVGGTAATVTEGKLQGVKMGSEVKLKANTGYKFRKVEVKKKAAVTYPLLSAATTSDLGKVVCAAGHLHDAKTAVPDGCTAVGIVGKVTSTGHGLILALKDATSQNWNTINGWTSASYAGTTLKVLPDDARGTDLTSYTALGETAVSNWAVAQKSDYDAIFQNLGSTIVEDKGTTYDGNVNAYITGVGGTEISGKCWSATEEGGNYARYFRSSKWSVENKSESLNVRPVLGF